MDHPPLVLSVSSDRELRQWRRQRERQKAKHYNFKHEAHFLVQYFALTLRPLGPYATFYGRRFFPFPISDVVSKNSTPEKFTLTY